jgi:hypothetical protein
MDALPGAYQSYVSTAETPFITVLCVRAAFCPELDKRASCEDGVILIPSI